jgi:hypothetical protein
VIIGEEFRMEIKGNIGEEIYVKARIKSINIDQDGVRYFVNIDYSDVSGIKGEDILFNAEPEEAPQGAPEEVAEEVVETLPKRRGRPRKTTVNDLMKKARNV